MRIDVTLRDAVTGTVLLCLHLSSHGGQEISYQSVPVVLEASAVLPPELLTSEGFKVRDVVRNDGVVNTYDLYSSRFGAMRIQGTPALFARQAELTALTEIAKLEQSEAYKDALEKSAKSPLRGLEALVDDPVSAVKGAATGIGRWFGDVGRAISSNDPHQAGVTQTALGQATAKRAFAYEFGIDPYSSFQPLQSSLDDLGWAAAGGGLTMKVAFALIPGAAGTIVSASGTADSMRALVRDNSPAQLEKINLEKLVAMGVSNEVANQFLKNRHYSPQDKTILVGELERMRGVKGRSLFIRAAARAEDPAKALFTRVRAQMMATHHVEQKSAREFVEVSNTLFVRSQTGVLMGFFPADHLALTKALADKVTAIDKATGNRRVGRSKELWLGGTCDPAARSFLEARGWTVHDNQYQKLSFWPGK